MVPVVAIRVEREEIQQKISQAVVIKILIPFHFPENNFETSLFLWCASGRHGDELIANPANSQQMLWRLRIVF